MQAQDQLPAGRESRWGRVITLGEVQQSEAPALVIAPTGVNVVWVGTDDEGVVLYERNLTNTAFDEALSLPIPSAYPHDVSLVPVASGGSHLFWIDAVYNQPEGDTRLWTARLNENGEMPRAHIRLSDIRAETYDAMSDDNGGALVVWTGGARGEPALYLQRIDPVGRPDFPERLTTDARFPTLVCANETTTVYWLRASDQLVMRGQLVGDTLTGIISVVDSPRHDPADHMVDFHVAMDTQTTYLFWTIVRADGTAETWFTTSPFSADDWSTPARLGIGEVSDQPYETSFNGGSAFGVSSGENWVGWASILDEQSDSLILSGQIGDELVVLYMRGGEVVAVQPVVTLDHALIGAPALYTDRDRHLYLTWSEPTGAGTAALNLTTTRAFDSIGADE